MGTVRLEHFRKTQSEATILKTNIAMAARRVAASSVNWAEFSRKIPAAQRASFNALKQKSDGFVRAVNALPEAAPKIDFDSYKSKIAVAGMVDEFQKKYEALDIPYPKDNVTASLDSALATKKSEYEKFVADSKVKIGEIQVELDKWEKMRPIEEMNKEEIVVQMPHLCTELQVRDPAQHSRKFMSLDGKFEQTYDEWAADAAKDAEVMRAATEELELRGKAERAKQGMDH